jgi:hypothetical protein
MKCNIELSWRSASEELSLTRSKDNDEQWVSPLEGARASVIPQIISVLDVTYADIRAALIATLPKEMQEHVSAVVYMSTQEVRDFMSGKQ